MATPRYTLREFGHEVVHAARHEIRPEMRVRYRSHTHDYAEVFWIERGSGTQRVNGRTVPVNVGTLCLVRPHDTHSFRATDTRGFTMANVAFASRTLESIRRRHFADERSFWGAGQKLPQIYNVGRSTREALERWLVELAHSPRGNFDLERFLLNLVHELSAIGTVGSEAPPWLAKACEEIRHPAHFRSGTRGFVELAGRSPEHVSRACRKWLGTRPTDIVNEARMKWASEQLALGEDDIMRIAAECGFDGLTHFYAIFRRTFGTTPRRYRLSQRALAFAPSGGGA